VSTHSPAFQAGLERFRRGEAGREEARAVVRHLLAGCPECRQATARIWPALDAPGEETGHARPGRGAGVGDYDYSAAFARAERDVSRHQLLLAEERAAVPRLRQELARHPTPRQEVLASNSSRFQTWPLVESLLDECRPLCQSDPEQASHLARLAIRLADRLDVERYGYRRVADLQARSWATLAILLRVQERYREAEQAFARARQLLRRGTGDPIERAEVLSLEASLWSNRCQFDRAIALVDRALSIARRMGARELLARALIQKAKYSTERGLPEEALPLLLEAQKHLDPSFDPRLAATLQHNILYALVETGRFEEAATGLAGTRALYEKLDYPVDTIRLDWLEGRVLHGLGCLEEAESRFRQALDGMLAQSLDFDAANIGLDLAVLYSQQNRNAEIRELAAAMLPVFTSHRIHREALAALVVFREAVARERLSTELAQDLAGYLRRAAVEPHLRFQPPPGLGG
jgi:tetratricopeptide (TPR) repeat protein